MERGVYGVVVRVEVRHGVAVGRAVTAVAVGKVAMELPCRFLSLMLYSVYLYLLLLYLMLYLLLYLMLMLMVAAVM